MLQRNFILLLIILTVYLSVICTSDGLYLFIQLGNLVGFQQGVEASGHIPFVEIDTFRHHHQ